MTPENIIISSSTLPVVFFDRDGTLNFEVGAIRDLAEMRLIPGASEAMARLNRANVICVVVTNQSGPARGYFPESHVVALNNHLIALLAAEGAVVDAIYYCPHLELGVVPEYSIICPCRKPKPGLIERAKSEIEKIDLSRGYVIGDQSTDIELAKNANLKSVLVRTGHGHAVLSGTFQWAVEPTHVADNVVSAVDWVLADLGLSPR